MPSALFDESAPSARLVPPGAQAAPTHARAPPEQLGSLRWPPQPASGRPKVDEGPFHGQVAYHRQSFLIISHHPLLFIGAGLSGFFVNITSFLLVKRTSSMTFKLLTMMRNGGLVLASGLFFGETITPLEAFGYGGLMVCFGLYTYIKTAEGRAAAESKLQVAATLVPSSSSSEERCAARRCHRLLPAPPPRRPRPAPSPRAPPRQQPPPRRAGTPRHCPRSNPALAHWRRQ